MRRLGGSPPEPLPDVYGRRRGPSVLALVGLALVTLVAGAIAGAGVTRLTERGAPAPRPVTAGVPGAEARATSHGISTGYAHTPEGAAQAVGDYLAALGGRLALDPAAAAAALGQVADPSALGELENGLSASLQVDEGLWGIQTAARQGKRVMLTQTPIAYKVTSYTDEVATIAVWLVTSVGVEDHQRLVAFYANGGATVAWVNGDWRLREIADGTAAGDVVPACLQTPTQTGGVPPQLDGFTPYGG